jgi:hypothetical protein
MKAQAAWNSSRARPARATKLPIRMNSGTTLNVGVVDHLRRVGHGRRPAALVAEADEADQPHREGQRHATAPASTRL